MNESGDHTQSGAEPVKIDPCSQHDDCPTGYIEWHMWALEKSKTHKQLQCPGCGLYTIWVPK